MATDLQITTARTNGAKSHGPVTPEGKARSSQNAFRHGLTARTVVLNNEEPGPFIALCETLTNDYQPQTEYEHILVQQLAGARWKLRRCDIAEKGLIDKAADELRPQIREQFIGADEELVTILAIEKAADSSQLKSVRRYMTQILREERHASSQLERLRRERPVCVPAVEHPAPAVEPVAPNAEAPAPKPGPEKPPVQNEPPAMAAKSIEIAPKTQSVPNEATPAPDSGRPKAA